MENNIVMEMKTNIQDYLRNALIGAVVAIPLICMGLWIFSICVTNQVSKQDVPLVLIIALIFFWIGIDVGQIAIGNLSKFKKSKLTYLIVTSNEIRGQINAKDFKINVEDLVSASIQVCSVACDFDGVPKNMNPGFFMKLYSQTNKYLCLFTSTGKTYYIDCLTSPETAKNTIDAIIAKNIATRKENV